MNPEERALLERTLKVSQENNSMLRKLERRARWSLLWWFIKMALIVIPLVVGYFYLQPYLDSAVDNYNSIRNFLPR